MSVLCRLLILLGGLSACGSPAPAAKEPTLKVSTSVPDLSRHLKVPAALSAVTWAARPQGAVGLGPTDLELVAWFPRPDSGFVNLDAALPPRPGPPFSPPTALLAAARAPQGPFAAARDGAAFETNTWTVVGVAESPAGLLVYAVSR
jgi:hypothetical protein